MARPLRRLARERRGVATIEFALWSVLILAVLAPCLDFALYLVQESRMSAAVEQAALLAYNMRSGTVSTTQLTQYVSAGSGLPSTSVTATVSCNGGAQSCTTAASSRVCACASTATPVTYTTAASCGSTCASGATSGFYLTVRGTHVYSSLLSNPWLNGRTMSAATTVRLQ